jgi:hypothetical protein
MAKLVPGKKTSTKRVLVTQMPEVYIIHHTDGHNKEGKKIDSRFQGLGHPLVPTLGYRDSASPTQNTEAAKHQPELRWASVIP